MEELEFIKAVDAYSLSKNKELLNCKRKVAGIIQEAAMKGEFSVNIESRYIYPIESFLRDEGYNVIGYDESNVLHMYYTVSWAEAKPKG